MMGILRGLRLVGGYMLGLLGLIGLLVTTASQDWVRVCMFGPPESNSTHTIVITKGPWLMCAYIDNNVSNYVCHALSRPAVYIWMSRRLMIASSILSLMALVMAIVNLLARTVCRQRCQGVINKFAIAGAVFMLSAGLCGLIASVWYPVGVHYQGELMKTLDALRVGWVGAGASLLTGIGWLVSFCPCLQGGSRRSYDMKLPREPIPAVTLVAFRPIESV